LAREANLKNDLPKKINKESTLIEIYGGKLKDEVKDCYLTEVLQLKEDKNFNGCMITM